MEARTIAERRKVMAEDLLRALDRWDGAGRDGSGDGQGRGRKHAGKSSPSPVTAASLAAEAGQHFPAAFALAVREIVTAGVPVRLPRGGDGSQSHEIEDTSYALLNAIETSLHRQGTICGPLLLHALCRGVQDGHFLSELLGSLRSPAIVRIASSWALDFPTTAADAIHHLVLGDREAEGATAVHSRAQRRTRLVPGRSSGGPESSVAGLGGELVPSLAHRLAVILAILDAAGFPEAYDNTTHKQKGVSKLAESAWVSAVKVFELDRAEDPVRLSLVAQIVIQLIPIVFAAGMGEQVDRAFPLLHRCMERHLETSVMNGEISEGSDASGLQAVQLPPVPIWKELKALFGSLYAVRPVETLNLIDAFQCRHDAAARDLTRELVTSVRHHPHLLQSLASQSSASSVPRKGPPSQAIAPGDFMGSAAEVAQHINQLRADSVPDPPAHIPATTPPFDHPVETGDSFEVLLQEVQQLAAEYLASHRVLANAADTWVPLRRRQIAWAFTPPALHLAPLPAPPGANAQTLPTTSFSTVVIPPALPGHMPSTGSPLPAAAQVAAPPPSQTPAIEMPRAIVPHDPNEDAELGLGEAPNPTPIALMLDSFLHGHSPPDAEADAMATAPTSCGVPFDSPSNSASTSVEDESLLISFESNRSVRARSASSGSDAPPVPSGTLDRRNPAPIGVVPYLQRQILALSTALRAERTLGRRTRAPGERAPTGAGTAPLSPVPNCFRPSPSATVLSNIMCKRAAAKASMHERLRAEQETHALHERYRKQIAELSKQHRANIKEFELKSTKYSSMCQSLSEENAELNKATAALSAENEQLRERVWQLSSEAALLRARTSRLANLEAQVAAQERENDRLSAQARAVQESIASRVSARVQYHVEVYEKEIIELRARIAALASQRRWESDAASAEGTMAAARRIQIANNSDRDGGGSSAGAGIGGTSVGRMEDKGTVEDDWEDHCSDSDEDIERRVVALEGVPLVPATLSSALQPSTSPPSPPPSPSSPPQSADGGLQGSSGALKDGRPIVGTAEELMRLLLERQEVETSELGRLTAALDRAKREITSLSQRNITLLRTNESLRADLNRQELRSVVQGRQRPHEHGTLRSSEDESALHNGGRAASAPGHQGRAFPDPPRSAPVQIASKLDKFFPGPQISDYIGNKALCSSPSKSNSRSGSFFGRSKAMEHERNSESNSESNSERNSEGHHDPGLLTDLPDVGPGVPTSGSLQHRLDKGGGCRQS